MVRVLSSSRARANTGIDVSLENVRVVLVGPIYGGNVGSVCRAMANMGLSDLALVDPHALDMGEARMMACHAGAILEGRTEFSSLPEAVADCGIVVGTSARRGLYRQHARPPREWAPRVLDAANSGPAAIVFGREDNGLSNEELASCHHVIQIPTTEAYTSLNVAQAVMVCCYELFLATGQYTPLEEKSPDAPSDLRERMFSMWRDLLLRIGFMEEDKADHMMLGLRRIWSRGAVTVDDVKIMMGIARQTDWAVRHGPDVDRET